jgi:X-Pro dipeptidyl-peptidase
VIDNVAFSGAALASMDVSSHRLLYATPVLTDTLHWSGTPRVTIRMASSKPAANLSVWLVTLPFDSTKIGAEGAVGVQSRGWADPQNHAALTTGGNYNSKRRGEPLVPGTFYDLTFDLQPGDRMIPPGKKLALMIMSSDRDFTLWPQPGTTLTVDLARTRVVLPVVRGRW